MKKKVLIVSDSLSMGGLEKCLINLCDNFDYERFDVDLYLFNEGRALLDKLNEHVNLLPDSPFYRDVYNIPFGSSVKTLLKKKKLSLALYRVGRFIRTRLKDKSYRWTDWKHMKKAMLKIDNKYDIAIGFAEGTSNYYVAECVDADVKIGWVHTDLKKIVINHKINSYAFSKLNHVVTVSENSLNSLNELYPEHKEKFKCIKIPGLMDYNTINKLAQEPNDMDDSCMKILSVGRLVELKGFHLCVEPCKRLVDEGYNVKWYVAGEGDYRSAIEEEIKKYGIENNFILLGNQPNPYTYIKSADICVQPSSYEGFSVTVFEGKYFKKPMVVSSIPSNKEMIEDGVNGLVIERNSNAIYEAVKLLLDDPEKRDTLGQATMKGSATNKEIMAEIELLFG